jgi:hypothetical protein
VLTNVVSNNAEVARFAAGSVPLGTQEEGHALYEAVATELHTRIRG